MRTITHEFGSSPRARGTVNFHLRRRKGDRFIPACAGNSMKNNGCFAAVTVHPRVRGEQACRAFLAFPWAGSSPRARGTACNCSAPTASDRFIPACAGNRRGPTDPSDPRTVHPRVRGEQIIEMIGERAYDGSSPRARGTVRSSRTHQRRRRFIPACAGNSTASP